MLEGGVGRACPSSLLNLPSLGPTTMMPARAAQPPTLCTMVEPAKSLNPSSFSHPPPHVHAPTTGYSTAVSTRTNRKKDHIFTRSAIAPDTMDAAVATKTIWKNQSDMVGVAVSVGDDLGGRSGGIGLCGDGVEECDLVRGGSVHEGGLADEAAR